jgi:hypothetical protein
VCRHRRQWRRPRTTAAASTETRRRVPRAVMSAHLLLPVRPESRPSCADSPCTRLRIMLCRLPSPFPAELGAGKRLSRV